jgi:predicted dinucleotide-binding enzyme
MFAMVAGSRSSVSSLCRENRRDAEAQRRREVRLLSIMAEVEMQIRKVGILGSGGVAQALGKGFIKNGVSVMLGTRDAAKLAEWKKGAGGNAAVGSYAEAAAFGEVVVLAVKGLAAGKVLEAAGAVNLAGKTVIDTTNPIADAPPVNGVIQYFTGPNESLMEKLQKQVPGARFVKCFSSVGNASMVSPDFGGATPTMFICGNDQGAKKQAGEILSAFGWEVEDLGLVEGARAIEPLAMLWCIPGFLHNRWTHAFKVLKK